MTLLRDNPTCGHWISTKSQGLQRRNHPHQKSRYVGLSFRELSGNDRRLLREMICSKRSSLKMWREIQEMGACEKD